MSSPICWCTSGVGVNMGVYVCVSELVSDKNAVCTLLYV